MDRFQLIIIGGLDFFCNWKVIPRNDDQNWKMIFNYEGTIFLKFLTKNKIGY